jgi:hypothetical protein
MEALVESYGAMESLFRVFLSPIVLAKTCGKSHFPRMISEISGFLLLKDFFRPHLML